MRMHGNRSRGRKRSPIRPAHKRHTYGHLGPASNQRRSNRLHQRVRRHKNRSSERSTDNISLGQRMNKLTARRPTSSSTLNMLSKSTPLTALRMSSRKSSNSSRGRHGRDRSSITNDNSEQSRQNKRTERSIHRSSRQRTITSAALNSSFTRPRGSSYTSGRHGRRGSILRHRKSTRINRTRTMTTGRRRMASNIRGDGTSHRMTHMLHSLTLADLTLLDGLTRTQSSHLRRLRGSLHNSMKRSTRTRRKRTKGNTA